MEKKAALRPPQSSNMRDSGDDHSFPLTGLLMTMWLKLALGLAAGSAGLLLLAMRAAGENEAALEQAVKLELASLRERLFYH